VQPHPQLALTLQAGYSAMINTTTGTAAHFVPVGVEAIISPISSLEIGASFLLDGYVGQSGNSTLDLSYFDQRTLTLWFRARI